MKRRLVVALPKMSTEGGQKKNIVVERLKKNTDDEWRNNRLDKPKINVVDMRNSRLHGNTNNSKKSNVDVWQNSRLQSSVVVTKKLYENSSSGQDSNPKPKPISNKVGLGNSHIPTIRNNTISILHNNHMLHTINNNGNSSSNNSGTNNSSNSIRTINNSSNNKLDRKLPHHSNIHHNNNRNMPKWQIKLMMMDRQLLPS
mmetsp:Transcript_36678/g.88945  ORF Transcript_36678/g.88945 Transcript_36678/m.88945 type:complete len:200 (+) Transcript_36678:2609-3208(+)